jgi:hypothetical protein
MDRRDLQPIDLVTIFGSEAAVDDAIEGRGNLERVGSGNLLTLIQS